uniref:DUF359 domain-containing protein n=1 Tax=Strongyloides venezuelensis TaxID=75913 RepID=A0A0K0EUR7_STRVS
MRRFYIVDFKLKAVKSIRQWRNLKPKLKGCKITRKAFRGPGPKWRELQSGLKSYVIDKRIHYRQVSTVMIKRQTKIFAEEMGYDKFNEKIPNFRTFIRDEPIGLVSENIGNMDKIPVLFDIVSGRTVKEKEKKDVLITTTGHERSNLTMILSATASRGKLDPLIIFKRKTIPRVLLSSSVIIRANSSRLDERDTYD